MGTIRINNGNVLGQSLLGSARESYNEIKQCVEECKSKITEFNEEIEVGKTQLRNVGLTLRQQQDALRDEYTRKFDDIIKRNQDKIEAHEGTLTELIGASTIAPISKKYEDKAKLERDKSANFLTAFYWSLVVTFIVGLLVSIFTWLELPTDKGLVFASKVLLIRFAVCIPMYLPLVWLLVHFNRWAAQKNRLAEEYDHKKLVLDSYIGLADQLDSLIKHGVNTARELSSKQLEKTIDVVCFDACSLLDKVKIQTPIDSVVKGFSKNVATLSDVVKSVAKPNAE